MFALVEHILLKPLPVADPDRLMSATLVLPQGAFDNFTAEQFAMLGRAPAIPGAAAWSPGQFAVRDAGHGESVPGLAVSPEYFAVLGIAPAVGRFPAAGDAGAVIGYRWWQTRFGGSAAAIGKALEIDGRPLRIVAVAPRDFSGTEIGRRADLFVPLRPQNAATVNLKLLLRLAPGVTTASASAQWNGILRRQLEDLVKAAPAGTPEQMKREFLQQRIELVRAGAFSPLRREFAGALVFLLVLAGVVLLAAAGNVAGLLLGQALAREREMAVRMVCGASRARIIRQLLAESMLLSVLGGVAGAILSLWLRPLLLSLFDTARTHIDLQGGADGRVLLVSLAVPVLAGLLFGLAPAFGTFRVGKLLVAFQVGLSVMLLVGAGLFVRTLWNLKHVETGFDAHNVALLRVDRADAVKYTRMLDAVRRLPGVQAASLSRFTPLEGSDFSDPVRVDGRTQRVRINFVYPQFFEAMGTPLVEGRDFLPGDSGQNLAIVNRAFVRQCLAAGDAVGRRFQLAGPGGASFQIVGVVPDMKYRDLREPAPSTVFYSALRNSGAVGAPQLSVRTRAGMRLSEQSLRGVVTAAGLESGDFTALQQQVDATITREHAVSRVSSVLGGFALMLTFVGLYGVVSLAVARRTREIGIRMALGAAPRQVAWRVLRQTLFLVTGGVAVGLPAASFAVRLVRVQLFGVGTVDPLTIVCSLVPVVLVAAGAGYFPARRAARLDPVSALRCE